jgi:cholesterol 7alpha-monooxygenase
MFNLIASILALLTLTLTLLLLRRFFYSLRPLETHNGVPRPPLLPDWIPFVGSALSMAGGDGFWIWARERCGPAFRVRAMGETRTFVTTVPVSSRLPSIRLLPFR